MLKFSFFKLVAGERYVYKFVCSPEALFNMAYNNQSESIRSSSTSSDKNIYFNQNYQSS
jgi:hypothetical protein